MSEKAAKWRKAMLLALLALALVSRLYMVAAPATDFLSEIEASHRMAARNFARDTANLLKPEVDWRIAGIDIDTGVVSKTGLMALPWLAGIVMRVVGEHAWLPRMLAIAFAVLGTFWFFRFVERLCGTASAGLATLLLCVSPYWVYCGRCLLPEPFAYAMLFGGLFFADRGFGEKKTPDALWATLCLGLAFAGQPRLMVCLFPLLCLVAGRLGWGALKDWRAYVIVAGSVAIGGVYAWWSFSVLPKSTPLALSGPWMFDHGSWLLSQEFYVGLLKSVWLWSLTPVVALVAIAGIYAPAKRHQKWTLVGWLIAAVALFLAMPGQTRLYGHTQLILVIPCVILAGQVLADTLGIKRFPWGARLAVLVMVGIACYNGLTVAYRLFQPSHGLEAATGEWLNEHTPEDARIAIAHSSPTTLYMADREGWTTWSPRTGRKGTYSTEFFTATHKAGATHFVALGGEFDSGFSEKFGDVRDTLYDNYRVHKEPGWTAFDLTESADLGLPEDGKIVFGEVDSRKYLRGLWAPGSVDGQRKPMMPMGPNTTGSIVFTASASLDYIMLDLVATVPSQVLTIKLNGKQMLRHDIPVAGKSARIMLTELPAARNGRYVVTIQAEKQDANGVSLLLYELNAG